MESSDSSELRDPGTTPNELPRAFQATPKSASEAEAEAEG